MNRFMKNLEQGYASLLSSEIIRFRPPMSISCGQRMSIGERAFVEDITDWTT